MAIRKEIVCYMCRLPKTMVLILMLQMRQSTFESNIDIMQIIVLRMNWIKIKNLFKFKNKMFYV